MDRITSIKPSKGALRRAAELGCDMARRDRCFKPDLSRAGRFDSYRRFRNAHREQLERSDAFVRRWQDPLFVLADKEARRLGLRVDDSMASWETWYNCLVVPLKNLLWEAWEHSYQLPDRFDEATHAQRAELADAEPLQVLRIATGPSALLEAAEVVSARLGELWGHPSAAAAGRAGATATA
jgi:hypothetical protein